MAQYIDKSAVVAEIENRKKEAESNCGGYKSYDEHRCDNCIVEFYEEFLEIINAIEVKEEGLNFRMFAEEMETVFALPSSKTKNTEEEPLNWEYAIAKHFFELGLKAK